MSLLRASVVFAGINIAPFGVSNTFTQTKFWSNQRFSSFPAFPFADIPDFLLDFSNSATFYIRLKIASLSARVVLSYITTFPLTVWNMSPFKIRMYPVVFGLSVVARLLLQRRLPASVHYPPDRVLDGFFIDLANVFV